MNRKTVSAKLGTLLFVLLLGLVTLAVSSWFFVSMGRFTGGELSMPLDDSYIYFQYARSFAEGKPFHYSPGDKTSTGATSLLYLVILAAGQRAGARGDAIIPLAFILGSCFLFLSSLLVMRIVRILGEEVSSIGAAVLLLTNGHVVWAYLSGMEVGLFASMILLTLLLLLEERSKGHFHGTCVASALMGFARPEGFFLALPVALMILVTSTHKSPLTRLLLASISLAGGLQFLLNWSLTGSFASTGTQAKSVFYAQEPDLVRYYLERFGRSAGQILSLFLSDFRSSSFGPNWAKVAGFFMKGGFLAAFAVLVFDKTRRNSAAIFLASWLVLSVELSLVPWAWSVHFDRYQVPFFPIFLIVSSAGLGALASYGKSRARVASRLGLALLFGATAISFLGTTQRMARLYAHSCENIYKQQVKVGKWINRCTPRGIVVGLNDAGAIGYYGEREVFDFVGIVTDQEALDWRTGMGSVIEALERLPVNKLPGLLAIYPNWLPFLVTSGIAGNEIFRAHLDLNVICGGSDKVVYEPDWSLLRSGHAPPSFAIPTGKVLIDSLDVADLESEKAHSYRVLGSWRSEAKVLADFSGRPLMDGGRRIFDEETMNVHCSRAKELFVLMRLDADSIAIAMRIGERSAGSALSRKTGSGWAYALFRVPVELVREQPARISLRRTPFKQGANYGSYHYWFFQ